MTDETHSTPEKTPARRRNGFVIGAVALLGLTAVGAGVVAAQDARPFAGPMAGPMAGHSGEHRFERAGFGDRGERMGAFMEWRIESALEDVDASPEQIARVQAILSEARDEILPELMEMRGTREAFAEIMGSTTIDRAAAEELRAERLAAFDALSARGLDAMLDAAEVLTPEQRAELAETMGEHRRGHGRW